MPYRTFMLYNALGAVCWAVIVATIGYVFGRNLPQLEHYIGQASLAGVLLVALGVGLALGWRWFETNRARPVERTQLGWQRVLTTPGRRRRSLHQRRPDAARGAIAGAGLIASKVSNAFRGISRMHRGLVAVLGLVLAPRPIVGQQAGPPYRITWGDAASVGTAGVLYVLPAALGLPHGAPSCAPCDPATLPGVDRWALHPVSATGDAASEVVLAGVAGFTAFAGLHGLPAQQWHGNFAVFANTASWTAASTEWLKVLVRRKRPVLYTSNAVTAATDPESQQSLPSLHTSLAFAAATSYLVIARRQHLPHRTRNALLLYVGAAGVAALRVAARQHFPTDVLAGAGLGSGIGWVVPTIHPTRP